MTGAFPPLSVVMAVHNGGRHLMASLHSIRAQTFTDYELIVVDDGSTDETAATLSAAARDDQRLTILTQPHSGLAFSLNRGIEAARASLIVRHDADDLSMPSRFEQQIAYMRMHPEVVALGTGAVAVGPAGDLLGPLAQRTGPDAVRDGLRTLVATPTHGSMMLRRDAVRSCGGYRKAFQAAQDLDLWLRLSERGDIDNLPDILYSWRLHGRGISSAKRMSQLKYAAVAVLLARERAVTGRDSYEMLASVEGDLDRFSREYRRRGELEAAWGELLFRGLNDPRAARPHLRAAIAAGHLGPRTLALFAWSLLGRRWPGGPTLQTATTPGPTS